MEYYLQQKLVEDKKFYRYLSENSNHIKYLNRNPEYYKRFMSIMKDQYKEKTSDKINDAVNTINVISSIIDNIN